MRHFWKRRKPRVRPTQLPKPTVAQPPVKMPKAQWVSAPKAVGQSNAPMHTAVSHRLDVNPNATTHIEMQTSAVDRAKGFLIASVPLYGAFALGVVLLAILLTNVPFWSFWAFCIFWLSFVLAWVWGYRATLMKSAEGIAHLEANRKWDVIEEEQRQRWAHYERKLEEREPWN